MSLEQRRGIMWAGVVDGHIATSTDKSIDEYTPMTIALFETKDEARRYYEGVIRIDVDAMLAVRTQAKPRKLNESTASSSRDTAKRSSGRRHIND